MGRGGRLCRCLLLAAARSRPRSRTWSNAGYEPEQEFVCRECESTCFIFSTLSDVGIYIAYIRILSRFYPFNPFPFLVLGSCTDRLFSSLYPIAPFSHPMARPQDLKDPFRQAGTILRAGVALGPDNRSRGFGKVVFATDADAERAVRIFNGRVVAYCGVWVGVELGI